MSGLDADSFDLEVLGASDVQLEGRVDRLEVAVAGASDVDVSSTVGIAVLDVSGASDLDFGNSAVADVAVDLSGASSLSVRRAMQLTGTVDGASTLKVGESTVIERD